MAPILDKALAIDTSILRSLIKRNFHAHHRTRYYRRLRMSLLHLDRHSMASLEEITHFIQTYRLNHYLSSTKPKPYTSKKTSDSLKQQYALVLGDGAVIKVPEKKDAHILCHLQWINHCLIHTLPQAISRIENACNLLLEEISKGFFLSLCCVALAAITRIRIILLRVARDSLQECAKHLECMNGIYSNDDDDLIDVVRQFCTFPDNYIGTFMETQLNNVPQPQNDLISDKIETIIKDDSSSLLPDIGESIHVNSIDYPSKTKNVVQKLEKIKSSSIHKKKDNTVVSSNKTIKDDKTNNAKTKSIQKKEKKEKNHKKKEKLPKSKKKKEKIDIFDDIFR